MGIWLYLFVVISSLSDSKQQKKLVFWQVKQLILGNSYVFDWDLEGAAERMTPFPDNNA